MKDYMDIASSPIMYIGVVLLLGIVFWQSGVFIARAVRRAGELNIPKEKLLRAARVSALTSIIPSIAIVIALLTLAPVLGLPFSWARLSIIGSLGYELMAAQIGAQASGVALGDAGYDASAFLTSVCTMTVGSFAILGMKFGVPVNGKAILGGVGSILLVMIPTSLTDFLSLSPMIGSSAMYIMVLTGNYSNLKIPASIAAMEAVGLNPANYTDESDVISTISMAVSAITSIVVIIIGVLLFVPLQPVLSSPILKPAFDNVVSALFGALGVSMIAKNYKLGSVQNHGILNQNIQHYFTQFFLYISLAERTPARIRMGMVREVPSPSFSRMIPRIKGTVSKTEQASGYTLCGNICNLKTLRVEESSSTRKAFPRSK